jgi:integrase
MYCTRQAVKRADLQPPQVVQAERLIDTAMAQDPELGLFLVLAVVLGARRGEVCRLRWSHIDLDRGEVLVGGKITSLPGELRDEEWTKNRSKRRVAIGATVVAVDCRLHDLRHFLVTQLIASGVDVRTVSGRVGHRDGGRTTLGTYAHFQAAQDRQAAELMERLLRLPAAGAP